MLPHVDVSVSVPLCLQPAQKSMFHIFLFARGYPMQPRHICHVSRVWSLRVQAAFPSIISRGAPTCPCWPFLARGDPLQMGLHIKFVQPFHRFITSINPTQISNHFHSSSVISSSSSQLESIFIALHINHFSGKYINWFCCVFNLFVELVYIFNFVFLLLFFMYQLTYLKGAKFGS